MTPHACGRGKVRTGFQRRERDDNDPGERTRTFAPRSEGDTDSEMTPTFAKDFIGEDSPATLPPPASMPSLSGLGSLSGGMPTALAPAGSSTVKRDASGTASSETPAKWTPASEPAGSPSDGTLPVPVLAVQVPPVPVPMPSLSETGSEGMPTALPPSESTTAVLSARDACQPQNARGSSCREGAALRALQRCACAYPLPQPLQINAHLLVSKRRRRRELEHELVTGGRHELEIEHVDRKNSCREARSG